MVGLGWVGSLKAVARRLRPRTVPRASWKP